MKFYIQAEKKVSRWKQSIFWYKLDNGDYLDHGFNGNHGKAVGITSVADRRGVAGRAAYFNGTTSMVTADFVKFLADTNISISFG